MLLKLFVQQDSKLIRLLYLSKNVGKCMNAKKNYRIFYKILKKI